MAVNKKALNLEMLKIAGFTHTEGGWSYPDGTMVGKSVPFFLDPELGIAYCFKWLVPKLKPKTLMMETYENGYDWCILSEKPSGGAWNGYDNNPALALCLAIKEVMK